MNKYSILLLAAATAVACSQEGIEEVKHTPVEPVVSNLDLRASFEGEQTRISTDDGLTFTLDEGTEQIGVYVETDGVETIENLKFTAGSADAESGWVSFTPEQSIHVQATSKIYAYAPYAATNVSFNGTIEDATRAEWDGTRVVNLPAEQTQTATHEVAHLAEYYTIVATPATPAARETLDDYSVDLQFSGVFALVKFVLQNEEAEPVTVSKLVFSSDDATLAGNFALNLKHDNPSLTNADYAPQPVEGKTESSVSVSLTTPVELKNGDLAEVYAVVNAGEFATATIEVYAELNGKEVVYTKQLTSKTITRQQRAAFGVKLMDGVAVSKEPVYDEATKTYTITTAEELAWVAEQTNAGNGFQGQTLVVSNDIDLQNVAWTPIGTESNPFKGTFDGAGHTISNLSVDTPDEKFAGLFGRSVSPAVLKNVTVENAAVKGLSQVGAIAGSAYTGSVENCHVKGLVQIEGNYHVGGISGYGYATFTGCSVIGNEGSYVKGVYKQDNLEGDAVGGIVGYAPEKGSTENKVISDCEAKIDVVGSRKVGGIVGHAGTNANVYNCRYTGNVSTNASEEYIAGNPGKIMVGGIVGEVTSGTTVYIKETTITAGSTVTGIDKKTTGLILGGSRTEGFVLTEENNTSEGAILIVPTTPWEGDSKEPAYDETTKTYTIEEGAELAWIAEQVNGGNKFAGMTITLNSDIDLNNLAWTPIGTEANAFAGTFDGAGHTVSNLSANLADQQFVGLFGRSVSPAVLKNVTVENAEVKGLGRVGGIVGSAYTGRVENCHVKGLIKIDSNYQAGGITSYGYASITGCTVIGEAGSYIKGTYKEGNLEGDAIGGIIGYAAEEGSLTNAVISNCVARIDVTGDRKVGGIAGQAGENANVDNCIYGGNLLSTATNFINGTLYGYVGGIVGELTGKTLFIKNCTVESGSTVAGKRPGALMGGSRTSGYQLTEENNITDGVTVTTK